MKPRPPVVVVLGHVDHGKTTLLDYIRKSHVAEKEYGAITQSIGAYEIKTGIEGYPVDKITFIDTPGHEAFTQLRARGANVADIALLIIDAKESVKPQTVESIAHIKEANIPFIVVLNKIDLPEANPKRVYMDLQKYNVFVDKMGGNVVTVEISAKTGQGVPDLLEAILLLSADLDLKYDDNAPLKAYIIETKKDKRGIVASVIVKDGRLKVGEIIYTANQEAKVRALFDDLGKQVKEALPSKPVEIIGFEDLPEVGSLISNKKEVVFQENKEAEKEKQGATAPGPFDIEDLFAPKDEKKKLKVILRADTQGSLEAISAQLKKNERVELILEAVGPITKSDVALAKPSKAIILGFNVPITTDAEQLASDLRVIIRTYKLIYELLDEIEEVLDLLERKEMEEKIKGELEILAEFIIDGQRVFGGKVKKGKISLGDEVEVYRGENLIGSAKIVSLKIRAKPVKEVKAGQECGIMLQPLLDIKVKDVIKSIL